MCGARSLFEGLLQPYGERDHPVSGPRACRAAAEVRLDGSIGAIYGQLEKEHLKSETDESWRIRGSCHAPFTRNLPPVGGSKRGTRWRIAATGTSTRSLSCLSLSARSLVVTEVNYFRMRPSEMFYMTALI